LVGAFIGFIVGVFVLAWPSIEFSPALDLGQVLDALAIVLVAVFIDYAYYNLASSKKSDTELLLNLVDQAKQAFCDLRTTSRVCNTGKKLSKQELSQLLIAARELSNAVHSIQLGLDECKISTEKMDFDKVKEARESLDGSLTGGPFPGPYDDVSLSAIQITMRDMGDRLTRLGFAICHR
jgi:hypothetical protein